MTATSSASRQHRESALKDDGFQGEHAALARHGRIGPNAIIQVRHAASAQLGEAQAELLFAKAGLRSMWAQPPTEMVDERAVCVLHQTVRSQLQNDRADALLTEAGDRTASYILANRIPWIAQLVIRALPAPLAARALLKAISKNAWTFAGSGAFDYAITPSFSITLTDCPACTDVYPARTACSYYAATMSGLFSALVHRNARVIDTCEELDGGRIRRFVLTWA